MVSVKIPFKCMEKEMLKMVTTYVRLLLEYSSAAYSPYLRKHVNCCRWSKMVPAVTEVGGRFCTLNDGGSGDT